MIESSALDAAACLALIATPGQIEEVATGINAAYALDCETDCGMEEAAVITGYGESSDPIVTELVKVAIDIGCVHAPSLVRDIDSEIVSRRDLAIARIRGDA